MANEVKFSVVFLCTLLPGKALAHADLQITGLPAKTAELGNGSAQFWATNEGNVEIICSDFPIQTVTPPIPKTPVVSNGTSSEAIALMVELPPEDGGQLLIDSVFVREIYEDLSGNPQLNIDELKALEFQVNHS